MRDWFSLKKIKLKKVKDKVIFVMFKLQKVGYKVN